MVYAVNYSDKKFKKAQKLNTKSAYKNGVNKVFEYSPDDIPYEFKQQNKEIWYSERGGGYWIWKPYIIKKTLEQIGDDDYLIYADSGSAYINNVEFLLRDMNKEKCSIMLFEIKSLERKYSKRDAFILMNCDYEEIVNSRQRCATFLVVRKCNDVESFISLWLEKARDLRIITDQENVMGFPNYCDFIDNRHDQTVLSLLSKKYGIKPFRDPSQYGNDYDYAQEILERSNYPQIFDSHRNPNITTSYILYKYNLVNIVSYIKNVFIKIKNLIEETSYEKSSIK